MRDIILTILYLFCVAGFGWVESKILGALKLGGSWASLIYGVLSNIASCVIAPATALCCVALGFLGVFGAINNTQHITAQEAFNAWAGPLALGGLVLIVMIRLLPLLLMNLKSPLKALLYGVISTAVLTVIFTITGMIFVGLLSAVSPPIPTPAS